MLFLVRCLISQDATPCSTKGTLNECGRPARYPVTSFLYCPMASAEPIHIGARDAANQGCRFDLLHDVSEQSHHVLTSGAHVLEWPVAPTAGSDQSSPSSSHEDPTDEHPETPLSASSHSCWKRDALQPSQVQHDAASRDACGHFTDGVLRCITWNTRGLVGSVLFSQKTRS